MKQRERERERERDGVFDGKRVRLVAMKSNLHFKVLLKEFLRQLFASSLSQNDAS